MITRSAREVRVMLSRIQTKHSAIKKKVTTIVKSSFDKKGSPGIKSVLGAHEGARQGDEDVN